MALFLVALVPVITDQVTAIINNAPGWFDQLQHEPARSSTSTTSYDLIDKAQKTSSGGNFGLGAVRRRRRRRAQAAVVRREHVHRGRADALLPRDAAQGEALGATGSPRPAGATGSPTSATGSSTSVGAYVSGAFVVALSAGISSLIFLFAVGLSQYAVALAAVVALLDVIPMIGATLGAVIVTAIGFATDPHIGLYCLIFYVSTSSSRTT